MSFERLDTKDNEIKEGRSCMILCNLSSKEVKTIANLAGMLGIRDKVLVGNKNGNTLVKDIINNKMSDDCKEELKVKAIIFNNIAGAKIGLFIENLKKFRLNNILKASVTETSKEWSLNYLLKNLVAEKIAMQSGQELNHEEENN